jgi:predicted ATPase
MNPQVRRRQTQDAVKRLLLRESLNQPLMLIFEDLHWIDEETHAFLNLLVEGTANAPVLLLFNYRPEYTHQVARPIILSFASIRRARRAQRRCSRRSSAIPRS